MNIIDRFAEWLPTLIHLLQERQLSEQWATSYIQIVVTVMTFVFGLLAAIRQIQSPHYMAIIRRQINRQAIPFLVLVPALWLLMTLVLFLAQDSQNSIRGAQTLLIDVGFAVIIFSYVRYTIKMTRYVSNRDIIAYTINQSKADLKKRKYFDTTLTEFIETGIVSVSSVDKIACISALGEIGQYLIECGYELMQTSGSESTSVTQDSALPLSSRFRRTNGIGMDKASPNFERILLGIQNIVQSSSDSNIAVLLEQALQIHADFNRRLLAKVSREKYIGSIHYNIEIMARICDTSRDPVGWKYAVHEIGLVGLESFQMGVRERNQAINLMFDTFINATYSTSNNYYGPLYDELLLLSRQVNQKIMSKYDEGFDTLLPKLIKTLNIITQHYLRSNSNGHARHNITNAFLRIIISYRNLGLSRVEQVLFEVALVAIETHDYHFFLDILHKHLNYALQNGVKNQIEASEGVYIIGMLAYLWQANEGGKIQAKSILVKWLPVFSGELQMCFDVAQLEFAQMLDLATVSHIAAMRDEALRLAPPEPPDLT